MQVKLGDIAASCPYCGTMEFIEAGSGFAPDLKLVCKSCGNETSRTQLLIQIGDKAARQAAQSLARLKTQWWQRQNAATVRSVPWNR